MTALSTEERAGRGHKAMEAAITTAARVRRQLKAGRPRTNSSLNLNAYEVTGLLVNQADRARGVMTKAGLSPDDIRLGLVIRVGTDMLCKLLPPPDRLPAFFDAITGLADAKFIGILWEQTDREADAKGQPGFVCWVTPLIANAEVQQQLSSLQAFIKATGTRLN